MIAGVVMSALILLAPNPRVGYLLYPINFFVWAYLLRTPADAPELLDVVPADAGRRRRRALSPPRPEPLAGGIACDVVSRRRSPGRAGS